MYTPEIITAILLLFIAVVVIQTFLHYFLIEEFETRPIYAQWFIIRGMIFIFHATLFQLMDMYQYIPIFCWQGSAHFIIFNPLLNKLRSLKKENRGKLLYHFWYVGLDSGWLDKLFIKDRNFHRWFYFGCCFIFVVSSIVIYDTYV